MSEEKISTEDFKILLNRLSIMMAAMTIPLIEKYGDEAKEYLKEEVRKRMLEYYKNMFDQMKIEKRDLKTFSKIFYKLVVAPLELAGQREEVIESTEKRIVTRATRCVELEAWKHITDRPEILCELDGVICQAMAEAFNPKFVYKKYSGNIAEGKIQWGLPWGKSCCEFIVEFVE